MRGAGRHAPFAESVCIALALSTFLAKTCLVADSLRFAPRRWSIWVPTLFLQDVIVCCVIYLTCRTLDRRFYPNSLVAALFTRLLLSLLLPLVHALNSIKMAYYWHSGALLNWSVAMELMRDASNWSLMGMGARTCAVLFVLLIPLFALSRHYSYSLATFKIQAPNAPRRNLRRLAIFIIGFYVLVQYFINRPRDPIWQALERNDLFAFAFHHTATLESSLYAWDESAWYIRQCGRMRDVIAAVRGGRTECATRKELDLSFLGASDGSDGVRNVVVIVVESLRSQFLPFNYSSDWAREHLWDNKTDITPVTRRLAERGWLFPFSRSACSYTVKALIGILCAHYPLLVNMDKEYRTDFPFDVCLPAQLAKRGYATAHFQSCEATFDAQDLLVARFGYDNVTGPPSSAEKVNVFGPHDRAMIPLMTQWVRKNHPRPFLLSFLSNMLHGPHRMPIRYKRRKFALDEHQNEYLNTLSHTDGFIDELLREMEAATPGVLNTTLFVITGDHGVALGERGRLNNNENPAEVIHQVPMLFYTENAALRRRLPAAIKSDAHVSAVDLVPSVLHLMRLSRPGGATGEGLVYGEGDSVFAAHTAAASLPPLAPTMQFSLTNPGYHSFGVREGDLKLVFYPNHMAPQVFRLSADPLEANPLQESDLSATEQAWLRETLYIVQIWRERNSYLYRSR